MEFDSQQVTDIEFIRDYMKASNAATGSKFDANANVENKNIVTMGNELHKYKNILDNRKMIYDRISELYGSELADMYFQDIWNHRLYKHDETATPGVPYCVAITMYPFLTDGLTKIGGISTAPTDLKSFCGEFINLVYSISSQFAGAVATPEYLMYMDYFIRKDYGDDYLTKLHDKVEINRKGRNLEQVIENCFQQVVHSMNMPAGNRGYQTVFWNVGYFDKQYFDGVFGDFQFPDGTAPKWETLNWLQKKFMKWFNQERSRYILTFPVETMAMLTDGKDIVDQEYADFTSEMWAEGHSFFVYLSNSPDSLSSCCRLRNSLKDLDDKEHNHNTHQFSMGTASVATGSKSVMTINLNRVIQDSVRAWSKENNVVIEDGKPFCADITIGQVGEIYAAISKGIAEITERVHKYQTAFNSLIKDFLEANMLPVYTAGFINMRKQYLTVGVNGLTDAAEFLGLEPNNNFDYESFVNMVLETINIVNRKGKTKELMFNTEFVPGENLSVKNYNWDKEDGYWVPKDTNLYASYIYKPNDKETSMLEKISLHGSRYIGEYLDGGSAAHLNASEHLSKEQYAYLLKYAAENGCQYLTWNIPNCECEDCHYISKTPFDVCPRCGSKNVALWDRIIGYLTKIKNWSAGRQIEQKTRVYEHFEGGETC